MNNLMKMIKKTKEDIKEIHKNKENLISQLSKQKKQKDILDKKINVTKNDLEKLTKKINSLLSQFNVKTSNIKTSNVKTLKKRGPKKGTKHYKNEMSLKEAVGKVMKPNVEMSPKDVASMVTEVGYKTKQQNIQFFRSNICTVLRNDNSIKKIGRGNYILASKKKKDKKIVAA